MNELVIGSADRKTALARKNVDRHLAPVNSHYPAGAQPAKHLIFAPCRDVLVRVHAREPDPLFARNRIDPEAIRLAGNEPSAGSGLQIPVHDAGFVGTRRTVSYLCGDFKDPFDSQWSGEEKLPSRVPAEIVILVS